MPAVIGLRPALCAELALYSDLRSVHGVAVWRSSFFAELIVPREPAIATKIGFVLIIHGRAPIRRHIQGPHDTLARLALFLVPFS